MTHSLLRRGVKAAVNHGEQSPILNQEVVAQPHDVIAAALHDLLRVPVPLEQEIQALMKISLRLLAGIVFGIGMAIGAVNFLSWLFPS